MFLQEGFITGDAPHPVYLVSSVGGLGLNSSGNSTPSHDVKVEEEDPLDENAFSDNNDDDHSLVRELNLTHIIGMGHAVMLL